MDVPLTEKERAEIVSPGDMDYWGDNNSDDSYDSDDSDTGQYYDFYNELDDDFVETVNDDSNSQIGIIGSNDTFGGTDKVLSTSPIIGPPLIPLFNDFWKPERHEISDDEVYEQEGSKTYPVPMETNIVERYPMLKSIRPKTRTNGAVVFDLDETFVHTFDTATDIGALKSLEPELRKFPGVARRIFKMRVRDAITTRGMGEISKMWGIRRPHVEEFLNFAVNHFRVVIVWSAGVKNYVEEIVKMLFMGLPQPVVIYARNRCTRIDGYYVKDLNDFFNHPELGEFVTKKNTLIVDDREVSFMTCPDNGVLIPAYRPSEDIDSMQKSDIALLQLKEWFSSPAYMNSKDVRKLNKSHIFDKKVLSKRNTTKIGRLSELFD